MTGSRPPSIEPDCSFGLISATICGNLQKTKDPRGRGYPAAGIFSLPKSCQAEISSARSLPLIPASTAMYFPIRGI